MTHYKTRYQAKKHMVGMQAIVKVSSFDFDGQDYAYVLMDYADYRAWRKQR
jgi:hypothetical protein